MGKSVVIVLKDRWRRRFKTWTVQVVLLELHIVYIFSYLNTPQDLLNAERIPNVRSIERRGTVPVTSAIKSGTTTI